ncbi:MAG: ammonia-forming cytochrome c nitrite reductase subunit c552 [Candidatus Aminicenantes bacterium]|nr:ammonia-forming cytochrome c nitrite reductase subunit c552 [Candidatus Aminicenantes bacterium]
MKIKIFIRFFILGFFIYMMFNCAPEKPEPVRVCSIADNEFDPEEWGKVYPHNYESWLKTKEPKPTGRSKFRKGWDTDEVIYDRLSEYPFSALLYNGWGFGIEYNEPRGHYYAIIDQIEIDPSRTSPGGVCLACKTPYHKSFTEKHGMTYLTAKFNNALEMLPEKNRELGPACIDCHKPADMTLTTNRLHIEKGLKMIGKNNLSRQELRVIACAQCHMTYYVPRDENGKVAGDVRPPWEGSSWGNISIENIINDLLSDFQREEWTQKTTGFRMPYIRHPEFELFSKSSVHWNARVACADCHMPYTRVGSYKISDHNVTSPIKANFKACIQCHTESADWLEKQVFAIQDRIASLIIRAGYATATDAILFEIVHNEQKKGLNLSQALYEKSKYFYKNAFLRLVFISSENSTGFHNPSEAGRILGDAIAFAGKTESLLRQMLAQGGIQVPEKINLNLLKYLNHRGIKKLKFKKDQQVKDPYNLQENFSNTL